MQCDICSARFKNMDSLRKHKKTHLEKSHECKICGNLYRNRNNLKAHMGNGYKYDIIISLEKY